MNTLRYVIYYIPKATERYECLGLFHVKQAG